MNHMNHMMNRMRYVFPVLAKTLLQETVPGYVAALSAVGDAPVSSLALTNTGGTANKVVRPQTTWVDSSQPLGHSGHSLRSHTHESSTVFGFQCLFLVKEHTAFSTLGDTFGVLESSGFCHCDMGIAQVLIVDEMASLAIPTLHHLLAAPVPLVLLLGTLSGAEGTGEKWAENWIPLVIRHGVPENGP